MKSQINRNRIARQRTLGVAVGALVLAIVLSAPACSRKKAAPPKPVERSAASAPVAAGPAGAPAPTKQRKPGAVPEKKAAEPGEAVAPSMTEMAQELTGDSWGFEPKIPLDGGEALLKARKTAASTLAEPRAQAQAGCLALATGDARFCDDLKDVDGEAFANCAAWATIHAAQGDDGLCERIEHDGMKLACHALAHPERMSCAAMGSPMIPAEQRKVLQPLCERVMSSDHPQCTLPTSSEGDDMEYQACQTLVMVRALREKRPELCDGIDDPTCKAFLTKNPRLCLGGTVSGDGEPAKLLSELHAAVRPFVLWSDSKERAAKGKTEVDVRGMMYATNLFGQKAALTAHITISPSEGAPTELTKELGELIVQEDAQRFTVDFTKPAGAKHKIVYTAQWR